MPVPKLPGRRRVQPAPFQRQSVDLTHHGRVWAKVKAEDLKPEDIVKDCGVLLSWKNLRNDTKRRVYRFPNASYLWLLGHEVQAFVVREDPSAGR